MSSSESPKVGVWQQLRRRRVTRTVVSYVAVGFTVMEGVWYLAPRLGLSDGAVRVVMGAVVLGFPLGVVLAWTYDVTPSGIVRTPDDPFSGPPETAGPGLRRSAWLLLCALVVGLGFFLRSLRL